ncbi:MAG: hypothetical protein CBC12_01595 [Candidatus Puniceispirillum sp. TMED52]|nr:MAG: hypothetical protein CBC12_01595 [Candidatus Puniceispirillum sp. TMED52]
MTTDQPAYRYQLVMDKSSSEALSIQNWESDKPVGKYIPTNLDCQIYFVDDETCMIDATEAEIIELMKTLIKSLSTVPSYFGAYLEDEGIRWNGAGFDTIALNLAAHNKITGALTSLISSTVVYNEHKSNEWDKIEPYEFGDAQFDLGVALIRNIMINFIRNGMNDAVEVHYLIQLGIEVDHKQNSIK